MSNIAVTNEKQ